MRCLEKSAKIQLTTRLAFLVQVNKIDLELNNHKSDATALSLSLFFSPSLECSIQIILFSLDVDALF